MTRRRRTNNNKWCPILTDISINGATWASSERFTFATKLAENTTAAASEAPHLITIKNLELTAYVSADTGAAEHWQNIVVAIMRLPEAFVSDWNATTEDYVHKHPEWVLGYKFIAKPSDNGDLAVAQPLRVKNNRELVLYPGDKLVAVLTGRDTASAAYSIKASGQVRYVVRAN